MPHQYKPSGTNPLVQRRASDRLPGAARRDDVRGLDFDTQVQRLSPKSQGRESFDAQVQRLSPKSQGHDSEVQRVAQSGTRGGGAQLPHFGAIQRAFGPHDVSGVGAHVGGKAGDACEVIGAEAYATGNQVAFARAPSLHTAAHEAAHVVQQKQGVQLSGGVGKAGDNYEKQADAVADAVVAGRSAADLLGLPGAAAAGQGGPVQMFRDPTLRVEANEKEGEHGFVSHDVKPSIGDDPRKGIGYNTVKSKSADVIQSDDGTLAINSANQGQEFYAKAGMVEAWNQKLAGNNTLVGLAEQGTTIDTPDGQLVQVRPTLRGALLENFAVQECFAVANIVLGKDEGQKDFEAVFQEEGEEERTMKMSSAKSDKVAGYLTDEKSSTDTPGLGVENQESRYVGKEYGKAIGKGKLSERVRKLGVNEHAKADVGESFVTYGVRAADASTEKGKTDYTKRKKRRGAGLLKKFSSKLFDKYGTRTSRTQSSKNWAMHYAGIVARSADGADRVSLEDYNRSDEIAELKGELLQRLRTRYETQLNTLPENATVTEALTLLAQDIDKLDWSEARNLANKAVGATGKGSWFMKMYGTRRGQTFHDQMVDTGDFVNPMTLRVRKEKGDKK